MIAACGTTLVASRSRGAPGSPPGAGAESMRGASAADRGARSARAQETIRPLPEAASGPRSILVYDVRRELTATLWDAAGPPPAEDARPCRAGGRRA